MTVPTTAASNTEAMMMFRGVHETMVPEYDEASLKSFYMHRMFDNPRSPEPEPTLSNQTIAAQSRNYDRTC